MVLMNSFVWQQWRHRHREQTCRHGQGAEWKEGVGQMKSIMKTYTLPYVK